MRAFNWRRGLVRLWLVLAVIWIVAVGWVMRPDKDAMSYWKLRSLDDAYIAAQVKPDEARCKRPDGSLDAGCMSAEWQRAQATRDVMKEALARKKESLSSLKLAGILIIGPIGAALILGFVFGWVAKGFSYAD